jgi:hypothetical protein
MGLLSTVEATLPNGFHDCDITGFAREDGVIVISFMPWLGGEVYGAPVAICISGWQDVSQNFEQYVSAAGKDTWFDIVESKEGDIEVFCGIIKEPLVIRAAELVVQRAK